MQWQERLPATTTTYPRSALGMHPLSHAIIVLIEVGRVRLAGQLGGELHNSSNFHSKDDLALSRNSSC